MYMSGETLYKRRAPLARAVVSGHTHTLDEIEDVLQMGPADARVAYLQSIDMVKFLVERYGWEAVAQLVHGYREGLDSDTMFYEITGHDYFDIEAAWHQDLRERYKWWMLLQLFDLILFSGEAFLCSC